MSETDSSKHSTDDEMWAPEFEGRYEQFVRLESGGMGSIFKAVDKKMNSAVAIKILPAEFVDSAERIRRFQREAVAHAKMDHPNIVSVLDFGLTKSNQPFMVMEFLKARSLQEIIETDGPYDQERAVPLFVQITEAMAHAHERGVIHRDLKPGNILVEEKAKIPRVKVIDFGIATVDDDMQRLTATGMVMGSPLYMSPEQSIGSATTATTDVYSFGTIMYFTLTGKVPFEGDSVEQTFELKLTATAPRINEQLTNESVCQSLEDLIIMCLQVKPSRRPPYMSSVRSLLSEVMEELELTNEQPSISPDLPEINETLQIRATQKETDVLNRGIPNRRMSMNTFGLIITILLVVFFIGLFLALR